MEQTPDGLSILNDDSLLRDVARVAVNDWEAHGGWNDNSYYGGGFESTIANINNATMALSPEMQKAEDTWRRAMEDCHGPLPDTTLDSAANYTLRAFMLGLSICADVSGGDDIIQKGGHPQLFDGSWCNGGFHKYTSSAFRRHGGILRNSMPWNHDRIHAFVATSRCALKYEFPIVRQQHEQYHATIHSTNHSTINDDGQSVPTTNRQRLPNWKPKRVILLSPTLGSNGATIGCKLLGTAYPRGWEVAFIEGRFRGLQYKYSDAYRALEMVVSHSDVDAEDTLVVFADAMDMLVQRAPEYVAEAFLDMTTLFSFSSETYCFPIGLWPHSIGNPIHMCDESFPYTKEHYLTGNKFANTGGWIGVASSALVVLKELSSLVENQGRDKLCTQHGTDQLLGNVAFLRYPSLIGLDYNYTIFASNGWDLLGEGKPLQLGSLSLEEKDALDDDNKKGNFAYRNIHTLKSGKETILSPAMLHFNGGTSDESKSGLLQEGYDTLISDKAIRDCRQGRVTIVSLKKGKVWEEDFYSSHRWQSCSADNFCAKQ